MNIINKLTLRHLKQNKRRTLVTILGVIISVAMVTAVATISVSFMELLQRQTIASEGEWHVLYQDVNKEQLEALKNDEATKALVISRDRGFALLEGGQNKNKPYLFVKEYNAQGFEQFPIELSQGRLPKANNEVVISEEIAENAKVNYEMGDRLTLDIGKRFNKDSVQELFQRAPLQLENGTKTETLKGSLTKSYTVVGVIKRPTWEPTWAPGYTIITYIDESMIGANETVNASVVLKKVKSSLYTHAEGLAKKNQIQIDKIQFNNNLLRYYGVTNNDNLSSTIYSLSAVIMGIIIIGAVSLIYNAFAISVSERSRHLGMLSSVGATKRQKRNSVLFEAAIIGLISIPLGIIGGLGGMGITFWFINPLIQGSLRGAPTLTVSVTPLSILIACVISMMTIFISAYLPARKASKISAIDAIRQTADVKLTGKAVKTSKFISKLFGIEAEIGLKNLKRNKRRYQATVFSLVISIVLFLAVSFFTANLTKSLELSQDGVNFDIQVSMVGEYTDTVDQLMKSIASLDNVTDYSLMRDLTLNSWVNQESMAKELHAQVNEDKSMLKNGKYRYDIDIHALNDENLKAYAVEIGVDYEQLVNPKNLTGIVIDTIPYKDREAGKYVETKAINTKIGETIDLFYPVGGETKEERHLNQLEIAALTNQAPMGVFPAGVGGLTIIVSEQILDQLMDEQEIPNLQTQLLLKSTDPIATQHQIEDLNENNLRIYNVYQGRQNEEQMILLMSVFTYGFIVLITAISIANIFNTISTSISLRKREFAMLKSVGMTPKGFSKMINYESIFYGIKSLFYGLPISIVVMYLIHRSLMNSFSYSFALPWLSILYVIAAVFIIVSSAMLYSSAKVKKENIIDALKQENI
ncbi:ABC transporter permease [Desulfosporosinus fructosivorans]|uniref:ABC transporter permease n=1 Tax=Desulfosporosinus fructosivorans TaxID=2018669 RepID=A0A4Z0QYW7_9FIRM|nr:ABC transporter permease [Desulfosporosinus fructosivorans]TGE35708.1 ABC transporter permease [Desulfosporosinus fructosivorans]